MPQPKITLYQKDVSLIDKKFTRILVTEDVPSSLRFVEDGAGMTTYRPGAGKFSEITARTFRTLIRNIIQAAKRHQVEQLVISLELSQFPNLQSLGEGWFASTIVENLLLASYDFTKYKSKQGTKKSIQEIILTGLNSSEAVVGYKRGLIVGEYTNKARDIANTHGDDLTPKALATEAKKLASGTKVLVKVLGLAEIKKQKLGLLEAVGKGSHNEPQFIIMEYTPRMKYSTLPFFYP